MQRKVSFDASVCDCLLVLRGFGCERGDFTSKIGAHNYEKAHRRILKTINGSEKLLRRTKDIPQRTFVEQHRRNGEKGCAPHVLGIHVVPQSMKTAIENLPSISNGTIWKCVPTIDSLN